MGIPMQIKTDNVPLYVANKTKQFFMYYNIKHATGIPHSPTGQSYRKSQVYLKKDAY